ncbi:hypothetical protein ACQEVZ_35810 [Dactylosporangium sp. CA-152071]|uniref:hypothetical protein n=1 Tax=Dactylosporangium sp. CA-152071 TaxID=3239933 RepID=UPI003D931264
MRVGDGVDTDGDGLAVTLGLGLVDDDGVPSTVFVVGTTAGGGTAGIARTGGGADRRTCARGDAFWVSGAPPEVSGTVTVGSAAAAATDDAGGGVRSAVRLLATARYVPAAPPATSSATPLVAATRRGRSRRGTARCRGANPVNSAVSAVSSCVSFRRLTCR